MSEPDISARYRELCPGITGRIITAHEAAEADAMRAALASRLLDAAQWAAASWGNTRSDEQLRTAALATVLALLLAPEAA